MMRAILRRMMGKSPEKRAETIQLSLSENRPKAERSPYWRGVLVYSLRELAFAQASQGQRAEALDTVDESITAARDERFSGDAKVRVELAASLLYRANLLCADLPLSRDEIGALTAEILTLLANRPEKKKILARAHFLQGVVLMYDRDLEAAVRHLEDSMELMLAAYGKYASADQRTEIAHGFLNAAKCYRELGETERADAYEVAGQDCKESGQELRLALSELRAIWSDFLSNRPPRP